MRKKRGIVLITTMLFVTVIVMIATLIATQGKMALQSGTASMQAEEAYMAALSGIDFVRGELRKEKTFGTTHLSSYNQQVPSTSTAGLLIKYDNQDLYGYIGANSESDYKSKFTISFKNVANTSSGTGNANYKHVSSDCKYLSLNNLSSASSIAKNISDGVRREVPAYSAYIVSKGVCGKAVRYAEAFLTSTGSTVVDNGSTIGGDITINSNRKDAYKVGDNLLNLTHVNSKYAGQLNAFLPKSSNSSDGKSFGKCKANISITGNGKTDELLNLTNKVNINGSFTTGTFSNNDLKGNLSISTNSVVDINDISSLDLTRAKGNIDPKLNPTNQSQKLTQGSYVYLREIDKDNNIVGKWIYVNDTTSKESDSKYNSLLNTIKTEEKHTYLNSPNFEKPEGINFGTYENTSEKTETRTIVVSKNIEYSGNVKFLVVDKINNNYSIPEATVDFQVKDGSTISTADDSKGSLDINGELIGNGNLIVNGDLSMNAGSSLDVDENKKVAIWAEGDIDIGRAKSASNKKLLNLFNSAFEKQKAPPIDQKKLNETFGTGTISESTSELIAENEDTYIQQGNNGVQNVEKPLPEDTNGMEYRSSNLANAIKERYSISNIRDNKFFEFEYNGKTYLLFSKENQNICITNVDTEDLKQKINSGVGDTKAKELLLEDGNFRSLNDYPGNNNNFYIELGNIYISTRATRSVLGGGSGSLEDFNIFIKPPESNNSYYYFSLNNNSPYYYDKTQVGARINNNYNSISSQDIKDISELSVIENPKLKEHRQLDEVSKVAETSVVEAIYNGSTKFNGTVYSHSGKIKIDTGEKNFEIVGALITANGGLDITSNKISLNYDPNYVPFFRDEGITTDVKFLSTFIGGE